MDLNYYQKINNVFGIHNKKDAEINRQKIQFQKGFEASPLCEDVLIDGIERKLIIVSSNKDEDRRVNAKPNEPLLQGSIVEWKNNNWLIYYVEDISGVYLRGKMRECIGSLKWIDDSGDMNMRYFTLKSDSATNSGYQEGRIITLGNERRTLLVSCDDGDRLFKKDQRFIIDSRAWKITAIDNISITNISILALEEDLLNSATDNLELEIADYYNNIPRYSIQILNGPFATIREDQRLHLNVLVTNNNSPISSLPVIYTSSDETIAEVTPQGMIIPKSLGSVTVKAECKNVIAEIGVSITETTAYSYTCEIIGSNEIKVGRSQSYLAKFYRNGIEYPDESKFSLTADDSTSETTLAEITTQDHINHSCSIKVGNKTGSFFLHVRNQNELSESKIKINIKPLF
jgi:hypothetical protein